ncbi:Na+/H+ antiporter NhaC [uncultured Microbulbifer sp.]|uniref:Na+/H+ antiporter NhaC n=1 Tax=uncultured Microbulbifer sp. TaxID=348147 RepID=UPI0025DE2A91|nr:Na+/H+ antiporter NhaC [uncultured Microbulbifer sp.]
MSDVETETTRRIREPSLLDALIPVVALLALLGLSYYLFRDDASYGPNQIALLFCALIAMAVAYKNGMGVEGIREAVVKGISTGLAAILILLAVGALIGAWAMSGTISTMVYYGLKLLSPTYLYATAAIISAVVGFTVGSSWTVAGTIGIGMMGIAQSMGLSPAITAGAVISGAYFGDKASPLSDTANLASAAAGSNLFDHIRESLWTSVPSLLLAVGIFALLGTPGDFDASGALDSLREHSTVSLWTMLPLLVVVTMALLRFPPFVTIFIGALVGGVQAVFTAPQSVLSLADSENLPPLLAYTKGVWEAIATGYTAETGNARVDELLSRGGMESMLNTVWLIITALAFGAVVEHAGLLQRLIGPLIAKARSAGALVSSVVATCFGTNVLASDQYIAIVLPARLFRSTFEERGYAPVMLSRVVGDSATVTSPLIPWNSCGAYMAAALGSSTIAFAPFCFFNLFNPLLTMVFSFVGFRVLRATRT